MKQKLLGLLVLTVLSLSLFTIVASADEEVPTTAATEQEGPTEAYQHEYTVVPGKKTVKVRNKAKFKKVFNLKKVSKYTYVTDNKKIATVNKKGVVTGKKKGSTIVRAIAKDGSGEYQLKVKVKNRFTKSAHRLMSAIINSEAGNQCYAGKKAVGIVIMNRMASPSFPNSLTGVVYQAGQFTPARNGSLNTSYKLYDSGKISSSVKKAATSTLNGDKTITVSGQKVNMKGYLFFSGYLAGAKLSIQGHQFK